LYIVGSMNLLSQLIFFLAHTLAIFIFAFQLLFPIHNSMLARHLITMSEPLAIHFQKILINGVIIPTTTWRWL